LPVALLAWEPRLDVVFLSRRGTEVIHRDRHNAVWNRELLTDLLFDRQQPLVLGGALRRQDEREHLDLVELMDPEDAACVPPRRTRLAPEARREPRVAEWQRVLREDLVGVE